MELNVVVVSSWVKTHWRRREVVSNLSSLTAPKFLECLSNNWLLFGELLASFSDGFALQTDSAQSFTLNCLMLQASSFLETRLSRCEYIYC